MNQTIKINGRSFEAEFTKENYFKFCQMGGRLDLLRVAALQWYQCCLILKATTHLTVDEIISILDPGDKTAGESIAAAIYEGWADFLGPMVGSGLADEDVGNG
ncbi:MAG: hypothetical protein ACQKBU_07330 [Verrucomicrobiales bacterium]